MCIGPLAPPKMQSIPQIAAVEPIEPAKKSDPSVKRAREAAEKRARSLAGSKSTIATSSQGLLTPESTGQTLLGSA